MRRSWRGGLGRREGALRAEPLPKRRPGLSAQLHTGAGTHNHRRGWFRKVSPHRLIDRARRMGPGSRPGRRKGPFRNDEGYDNHVARRSGRVFMDGGVSCARSAISKTSPAFSVTRKRRKSFPSETHVKRGRRFVHGGVELTEKLGRNDLCPCGSRRRFQNLLHEIRRLRRIEP
jgi:hypothetical protein